MIFNADCKLVLVNLPDNSIDSLVTDPPAGIGFMGKEWDGDKGGRDAWIAWMTEVMREVYRVLKPGAHGLVWALPRTSHWTATAVENAGFEIRDTVVHLFGTGFPKSLNISKAIDKTLGVERAPGPTKGELHGRDVTKHKKPGNDFDQYTSGWHQQVTAPATAEAKQWDGWGTALKPAHENWILIRKPLSEKTVASNVLKHGTGGINVDACRIEVDNLNGGCSQPQGRFPANLVLSEESAAEFDASRFFYVAKASRADRGADNKHPTVKSTKLMEYLIRLVTPPRGIVLDPFMGSGSTGVAAKNLGFEFQGIEQNEEYFEIAKARLA